MLCGIISEYKVGSDTVVLLQCSSLIFAPGSGPNRKPETEGQEDLVHGNLLGLPSYRLSLM